MEPERSAFTTWGWAAGVLVCLLLVFIGWLASPVDSLSGRPLLLLPDVKAVEDYRRQASSWVTDLRLLDGSLEQLLAGNTGDLFAQSRRSQSVLEDAAQLVHEIDIQIVPSSLSGLQVELAETAAAYQEAARAASGWVSIPDEEHYRQAAQAMEQAHALLGELEGSQWLKTQP